MKVFITDDHDIVIEGYRNLIKSYGFQMVGFSKTGQGLIDWLDKNTCDIVILDLSMPNLSGIEVLEKLSKKENLPKFIVVSGTYNAEQIKQSIILGILGFICKDEVHIVLRDALERVLMGRKYFSDVVMDILVSKQLYEEEIVTVESLLSTKESQTLKLMMDNLDAYEICEEMNITQGTLRKMYQRMREKLGVKKNIGLVILALKHNFKIKK
ncbi:response regulator transcription factor [Tenacibaculum agarivorans]|uniref:response regulator transcription factor n=1 Tax=Tenacibaculum agarivorans TaxID=1908389 RepID=UPI00094BC12E|nr:response regulator transcription factor [Tenacibaculum agarivorans]